jgi:hypothetical protein
MKNLVIPILVIIETLCIKFETSVLESIHIQHIKLTVNHI